ncbi:MAG: PhoH family protein, partial [Bacillota bacterium]
MSLDELGVDNLESNGFLNLNTSTSQSSILYFKDDRLTSLNQKDYRNSVYYVKARNREQSCAFKLLTDRDVELVTLVGKAGTGKTLLALAAALQQVVENQHYQKIIVARPPLSVGEEIGFLPGNEREKLDPWMQPIWDNLELIFRKKVNKDKSDDLVSGKVAHLEEDDKLEVGSLSHIRG